MFGILRFGVYLGEVEDSACARHGEGADERRAACGCVSCSVFIVV